MSNQPDPLTPRSPSLASPVFLGGHPKRLKEEMAAVPHGKGLFPPPIALSAGTWTPTGEVPTVVGNGTHLCSVSRLCSSPGALWGAGSHATEALAKLWGCLEGPAEGTIESERSWPSETGTCPVGACRGRGLIPQREPR